MNNFQPYKLSQRSVKISYVIKPYTLNVTHRRVLFNLLNIIWVKPILYQRILAEWRLESIHALKKKKVEKLESDGALA